MHIGKQYVTRQIFAKGAKVYPASGQRSSKRVPMDLGNNRHPLILHVVKGDLVGPGGWSVINYPQTKRGVHELGFPITNSPVVGGAPKPDF